MMTDWEAAAARDTAAAFAAVGDFHDGAYRLDAGERTENMNRELYWYFCDEIAEQTGIAVHDGVVSHAGRFLNGILEYGVEGQHEGRVGGHDPEGAGQRVRAAGGAGGELRAGSAGPFPMPGRIWGRPTNGLQARVLLSPYSHTTKPANAPTSSLNAGI